MLFDVLPTFKPLTSPDIKDMLPCKEVRRLQSGSILWGVTANGGRCHDKGEFGSEEYGFAWIPFGAPDPHELLIINKASLYTRSRQTIRMTKLIGFHAGFEMKQKFYTRNMLRDQAYLKLAFLFSTNAETPSTKSSVAPQIICASTSFFTYSSKPNSSDSQASFFMYL